MSKRSNHSFIHFKNSETAWKKWKIGDVLTEKYRPILIEDEKEYQLVTVKRRNEGVVSRGYLKGKNILVKNYFEVEKGDFIISKRQIIHGASGIVPQSLHKAVVSNEYLVAVSNENISTEYLTLISKLPGMYKQYFLSSFGVDVEKMVFDVRDWKKRSITIPDINEQKKITDFFQDLDKLITEHQQKHEKIKVLKKAMLSKMFPQEGQTMPEIRFKGFSGDWVEHEVGKIFKVTRGTVLAVAKLSKTKSESMLYPVYSSQTTNNGLLGYYNEYLFEDAITWTTDGANAGTVNFRKGKFYSTNVNGVLLSEEGFANTMVAAAINKLSGKYVSRVGNPKLMNNVMSQIKITIPRSIDEQNLISQKLDLIDNVINLYQLKLIKLQNIKKAFLAKMFI